jgi:type II secretory pathway pseudopilin PulG
MRRFDTNNSAWPLWPYHAKSELAGNSPSTSKTRSLPPAPVRTGFTLAEALLAVMLLGIAASSVLLPFTAGTVLRKEGSARTLASNLASEQMERILATPFAQVVTTWNNTIEPAGQVKDAQGNTLVGNVYSSLGRTTTCSYIYVSQQSGQNTASLISVRVEVSYRGAPLVTLDRLITE